LSRILPINNINEGRVFDYRKWRRGFAAPPEAWGKARLLQNPLHPYAAVVISVFDLLPRVSHE
jgi:hypothetical protein